MSKIKVKERGRKQMWINFTDLNNRGKHKINQKFIETLKKLQKKLLK